MLGYCFHFITIVFILFNSFEYCLFKCTRNRCLSRGRLWLTLYVYVYHNSNFQLELRKYPTCFECLICFRIKTLRASLPKRTRSRQKMSAKVFRSFIVAGGDKDLFSGKTFKGIYCKLLEIIYIEFFLAILWHHNLAWSLTNKQLILCIMKVVYHKKRILFLHLLRYMLFT